MKNLALIFIGLLMCITIISCKKDKESNDIPETYFEFNGKTYGLSKGFFIEYGESPNNNYEFDIFMYSGMHIYDPDSVVGSGNTIGFNIYSAKPNIESGTYEYNEEWDVTGTFDVGLFVLEWDENDPENQDWVYISDGNISIQNNNNVFDISFECTSTEGKSVKGRYRGTPDFFNMELKQKAFSSRTKSGKTARDI